MISHSAFLAMNVWPLLALSQQESAAVARLATCEFSGDRAGIARERAAKKPKMRVGFKRKDAIANDDSASNSKEWHEPKAL